MNAVQLLEKIRSSPRNNRDLDEQIGLIAGFKKVMSSNANGANVWIGPGGSKPSALPGFTNSIDIARNFIELVAPGAVIACKWNADAAMASSEDLPPQQAATPALALCLVGILLHQNRKGRQVTL